MKVEIYSDVACPWCYIGKRRFERALETYPDAEAVEVVYRPYQLDPDAPVPGVPMLKYLEARFGTGAAAMAERVTAAAAAEGLEMDYERGIAANTLDAHRLLRVVEREGGGESQRAAAERLFAAHFAEGADIADPEVLVAVAAEVGLDPERVRVQLASGEGRAEVREEIAAAQGMGITAVPTFVFDGRWAVQGAQPSETFLRALRTVATEVVP